MNTLGSIKKLLHTFFVQEVCVTTTNERTPITLFLSRFFSFLKGAVGVSLLVGVGLVATPLVYLSIQENSTQTFLEGQEVEFVSSQEEVVGYLKLNSTVINTTNETLSLIYLLVQENLTEDEKTVLRERSLLLEDLQKQISTPDSRFAPTSNNTKLKINILLSAIGMLLDKPSLVDEDLSKLNAFTHEFQMASEKEKLLVIALLKLSGMTYEILPDGQLHYSYLKKVEETH